MPKTVSLVVASLATLAILIGSFACGDKDNPVGFLGLMIWNQRVSGTTDHLKDVVWNGKTFVAVGTDVILSSRDGITWSSEQLPIEMQQECHLKSVAWSDALQLFLAVGFDNVIMTSPDGAAWTTRESGLEWGAIRSAAVFDTLLVVSCSNPVTLLTSGDGISWTRHDEIGPFDKMDVSDTLLIGVGGPNMKSVYSSSNGTEWTLRHSGDNLVHCITWHDESSQWLAAGHLGHFLSSPDGLNWTGLNTGAGEVSALQDAHSRGKFCAVVGNGNGPGLILSSTDLVHWIKVVKYSVGWLNGVTASPDRFVAVGEGGFILTCP